MPCRQEVSDEDILRELESATYDEVSRKLSISRGRIWSVACKHGARKNEARIRERASERKQRQREFLSQVINAVQTLDVLDYLDGIPNDSVQLVCTSPPYNVGKGYGNSYGAGDSQRFYYYVGWLLQVCSELDRILVPGGTLFLQVGATRAPDGRSMYPIDAIIHQHLVGMGLTFQNRVVWPVPHGLTPKGRLANRYETALIFSKGAQRVFNPGTARAPTKQPGKRAFKGPNKGQLSSHPLGSFPTDVWADIGNCGHNSPDKAVGGGHPAQFPQKLARRAILLYSIPGDRVCDPFMGSGTTAVEAKRTGREFMGCDLFYADTRRERLSAVSPDLVTELPGVTDESIAVWQAEARAINQQAKILSRADHRQLELEVHSIMDGECSGYEEHRMEAA